MSEQFEKHAVSDPEYLTRAGDLVRPPAFDTVTTRGRRLRSQRRVALSGVAAVTAVAVGVGAWTLRPDQHDAQPAAATTARPTATDTATDTAASVPAPALHGTATERRLAEAWIASDGVDRWTAVDPEDPMKRVTIVRAPRAEDPGEYGPGEGPDLRAAVAFTTDGFATRSVMLVTGGAAGSGARVSAVGGGRFLLMETTADLTERLFEADGTEIPLRSEQTTGPVTADEVLYQTITQDGSEGDLRALDPVTGVSHPVPSAPSSSLGLSVSRAQGRLVLSGTDAQYTPVFWSSEDGGTTWDKLTVTEAQAGRRAWFNYPAAAPGDPRYLWMNDDQEAPFTIWQSTDGTSWRQVWHQSGTGGTAPSAAVREGRLVFVGTMPGSNHQGLYSFEDGGFAPLGESVGKTIDAAVVPATGAIVVTARDGSFWSTTDGTDWERLATD